jgi:hypothetical protein
MVLMAALAATPAFAEDGQHRHDADRGRGRHEQTGPREHAVPRSSVPPRVVVAPRHDVVVAPRHDNVYVRRSYPHGVYAPRTVIVPHVIRPRIVTVVPYRPYIYRPSFGIGVYYGANGYYPYGNTPQAYFDPIPGRAYGGVRITGAPRDAQVFADGYYVGIVNDFDGVFQHMNLEAGPHHIEIQEQGYEPITFDVVVQPGQTITYRADLQ